MGRMCPAPSRKPSPSAVSDDDWPLVVAYLTPTREAAPQRAYPMRELFSALRDVIRYGIAWRAMPDFPPSAAARQQSLWLAAGCFETPAQGAKVHRFVDTLAHLRALHVTQADVGDRAAERRFAADIQGATGERARLVFAGQG